MRIHNVTPHPIVIYPVGTPDRIDPDSITPYALIPVSEHLPTARIGQIPLGTQRFGALPVELVEYMPHGGLVEPLPPQDHHDPHETWYVVSLVVAIGLTYSGHRRSDLLVPYREVRNMAGTMVGCRQLAQPV